MSKGALWVIGVALLLPASLLGQEDLNILVIHGYDLFESWSEEFNAGLEEARKEYEGTVSINFYTEYLDYTRIPYSSGYETVAAYLREKYQDIEFHGAIADTEESSTFLRRYMDHLHTIPRVYISLRDSDFAPWEHNFTYQYNMAVPETLLLIAKQNPDLEELVLVKSWHVLASRIQGLIEENLEIVGGVTFSVIENFSTEELYRRVSTLPENAVLIYTPVFRDTTGRILVPREVLRRIVELSGRRVYSFWSPFLGTGIVGGSLVDGASMAQEMVRAAIDYQRDGLFKEDYTNLRLVVDWNGIVDNGINTSLIPEGTHVINQPASLFVTYFRQIMLITILVISIFLLITVFWLRNVVSSRRRLREANEKLEEAWKTAKMLSERDALTGLYNRRAFTPFLTYEIHRKNRSDASITLVILDIDHFKKVNDVFGHDTGDRVLKYFAETIEKNCRSSDRFARWGGEEFLMLLPETGGESGLIFAEKLRKIVAQTVFPGIDRITASFGVAELCREETFEQWFSRVDSALYKAKVSGRNRAVLSTH